MTESRRRRRLISEQLEERKLLSVAIPTPVEDATRDVLQSLRDDVAAAFADNSKLQTVLPIIGEKIADKLDLATILDSGLFDPIDAYFAGAPTDTGLQAALEAIAYSSGGLTVNVNGATVAIDNSNPLEPVINMSFTVEATQDTTLEGAFPESTIFLDDPSITFRGELTLPVSISMPFLSSGTVDPEEILIDVNDGTIEASVTAFTASTGRVGLLGITVGAPTLSLNVALNVDFSGVDGNGNLSLVQSTGGTLGSLLVLTPTSNSLTLSVPTILPAYPTGVGTAPTLAITVADVFAGGTPTWTFSAGSTPASLFQNMSEADVQGLFSSLASTLNSFATQLDLADVPFIEEKISDIIDLGAMITDWSDALQDDTEFVFHTIEELASEIAAALGTTTATINPRFVAGNAVEIDIPLNKVFSETVLLGFSEQLGILTAEASAEATFSATVTGILTLGFDLDPVGVGETLSDRFYIAESSGIDVAASISVPDLDMGVSVGPLGLCVIDGNISIAFTTGIDMVDPGTSAVDAKVYLREIINAGAVTDVTDLAAPTVNVSGAIPVHGCDAATNALLGINPLSPPTLNLGLGVPNDITSFSVTPDANFNLLLDGFNGFGDLSMNAAFGQIVAFLNSANIEAFNAELPLIGVSINELLGFASGLNALIASLNTDFPTLKISIEALLPALDAQIALAAPSLDDLQLGALDQLRNAMNAALGQLDLSGLASDFTGIIQGFNDLLVELSATITVTGLQAAIDAIEALIPTFESLETRLEAMLGIAPGDLTLSMQTIGTDRALIVNLTLGDSFAGSVPLDFAFEGSAFPIGIESGGSATASVGLTAQLDFGINLDKLLTDPANAPFLLDTTSLTGTALIDVPNLTIVATIGGVTGAELGKPADPAVLSIKEKETQTFTASGSTTFTLAPAISASQANLAIVTVNGTVQDPDTVTVSTTQIVFSSAPASGATVMIYYPGAGAASIGFTMLDASPDPDGVIPFSEIALSSFAFGIDGLLNVKAPLYLPLAGDTGDFRFFMDLGDFDTLYGSFPDDFSTDLSIEGCDPTAIIDGLQTLLEIIQAGLEADILDSLPIISDGVDLTSSVIGQFQSILTTFETIIDTGVPAVQQFLYDYLGPGDGAGPGLDLNVLYWDHDSNAGTPDVVVSDPSQINVVLAGSSGDCLLIDLHIISAYVFTADFDLGLDALIFSIATSGGVEISLGMDLEFGFGITPTDGFYFTNNTSSDPEFEFDLDIGLATGTSLNATLFFINMIAEDGSTGTGLNGSLDIDIVDPDSNGKLTLLEIGDNSFDDLFDFDISASATIDLDLAANIASDASLPSVSANLFIQWLWSPGDDMDGQKPTVEIRDVSLVFGTFLSNLFGPAFETINEVMEPIRPFLDFLETPIPVISDVAKFLGIDSDGVTPLEIIATIAPDEADTIVTFLDALITVDNIVASISSLSGSESYAINFGNFAFGGSTDLRDGTVEPDAGDGSVSGSTAADDFDDAESGGGVFGSIMGFMDDLEAIGLSIPLFDDPSLIFNLLLGQRVDLVTWDIPRMSAGIYYEQMFGPLFPVVPLFARIFGGFEVFADIGVGIDTRGFEEGNTFLDGFYFRDFKDGKDEPEVGITATIGAGAELNVVVAKAGVEGGITGTIGADWNDVDDDGKLYMDELGQQIARGLECVFDLTGSVKAFLNFYASLGLDTPFGDVTLWEKTINLVNVTIFEFTCTCPPLPPPVLGHVSDGTDGFAAGTFVAHIGAFAADRQPGAEDEEDKLTISQTGPNTIFVKGYGEEQTYNGVTSVYINALDFDDQITIDQTTASFTLPTTILGGDGSDRLLGGSGADSIKGEDGADWIYGYDGNDTIDGGDDADVIFGGKGNDSIIGGKADDQLYGEDGDDTIYGGDGGDIIYGDDQPDDDGNSSGNGADRLYGEQGDDQLNGAGGNDSLVGGDGADFIEAMDGNDSAYGDDGDDVIYGGAGADLIHGGEDNDQLKGDDDDALTVDGNDTVYGESGFDYIEGAGGADFLEGGSESDAILGGLGNDQIFGSWGNDVLRGEDGADYIEGGPDDDDICGQALRDTIYGGTALTGYSTLGSKPTIIYLTGGFSSISCGAPITWTPPVVFPSGKGDLSGQKYHDLNANGTRDPGEQGLNQWEIKLYKTDGTLVATTYTAIVDINSDGVIDPETEWGVYSFTGIAAGSYKIAETLQGGWFQSEPASPLDAVLGTNIYNVEVISDIEVSGYDFGNYRKGTISGHKFNDLNGDGVKDSGESYMPGWTIELYDQDNNLVATRVTGPVDLDGNGTIGAGEHGAYRFANLMPGTYRVVEMLQGGWMQTVAPSPISVISDQVSANNDFGNVSTGNGEVTGTKWNDLNGDGKRQSNEPGLAGVKIYQDMDNNGAWDVEEPYAITMADDPATLENETGNYVLTVIGSQAIIREVVPAGYAQTWPAIPPYYVFDVVPGMVVDGADFGNSRLPGSVEGVKWFDRDKDGKRDPNEPGLPGWTIYLDLNNNDTLDPNEPSTVTGQGGTYSLSGVPAGSYIVREELKPGWSQTAPTAGFYTVTVSAGGTITGMDFGNVFGKITGTDGIDGIKVRRNPDGDSLDIWRHVGSNEYVLWISIPFSEISGLDIEINLKGGNDDVEIDLSNGSPKPLGGSFSINGGGASDKLTVTGLKASGNEVAMEELTLVHEGISYAIAHHNFEAMEFHGSSLNDTLTITQALPFSPVFFGEGGSDTLRILGGQYNYNPGILPYLEQDNVFVGGTSVFNLLTGGQLPAVQLDGNARLNVLNGAVLGIGQLLMGDGSVMDLRTGTVVVDATAATAESTLDMIYNLIGRARNSGPGLWQGKGILTSMAGGNSNKGLMIAYKALLPAAPGLPGSQFATVIDYTYAGDANLNGQVNADDYFVVDEAFSRRPFDHIGNFNFMGGVDIDDYFLIDRSYATQTGPLAEGSPGGIGAAASGEINGAKWNDLNGNGVRDAGEPGVAGVTIYLDLNNNGVLDATDMSTVTMADNPATPGVNEAGRYQFVNLNNGTYIVREVVPAGFVQTAPATGFHTVTVQGTVVSGRDFGNRQSTGGISGTKWQDLDGDGVRDPNEPGLPGVTIYLDLDGDGVQDPNEPTTVTQSDNPNTPQNEAGTYSFDDLPDGMYIIREMVPPGYSQTYPTQGYHVANLDGNTVDGKDFGNRPPGGISGTKWNDLDGDGVRDANEPGLAGVTIYLDLNNTGKLDGSDISTVTMSDNPNTTTIDETGQYGFTNLAPGTYIVREVVPSGYEQTAPATGFYSVALQPGSNVTGRDFGNKRADGGTGGTKWQDLDGDGVRDPGEPGLAGVIIYIDTNNNGRLDEGEPWTMTSGDLPGTQIDETGMYVFTNVPNGTYLVREVVPAGYAQTFPNLGRHVVVIQGEFVPGKDFGNRPIGEICGIKYDDLNGNGRRDAGEPGLPGVTIYIDLDNDGRRDENEPSVVTNSDNPETTEVNEAGQYCFTNLPGGTYVVREVVPRGWAQTAPQAGFYTIVLQPGQAVETADFANTRLPGTISGTKWLDQDADRIRDAAEPGLAGITIYLDLDNDGVLDPGEPTTITQSDGSYTFTNVEPGSYFVREVLTGSYGQSSPGAILAGIDPAGELFQLNLTTGASSAVRVTAANLVGITASPLDGRLYGLSTAGDLLIIDPITGSTGLIGNIGLAAITEGDLAFDPVTSRLYALNSTTKQVRIVDANTAASIVVGTLPASISDASGLAFNHDGRAWVLNSATGAVVEINPTTLAQIGSISAGITGTVGGAVFDPLTGLLYVANGLIPATGSLYSINIDTSVVTNLGPTSQDVAGLAFLERDYRRVTVNAGQNVAGVDFGNFEGELLPDGDDLIHGGGDQDRIFGDNSTGFPPTLITTGGDDTIYGNADVDEIHGQEEDDLIYGGSEADNVWGDIGDDTLIADGGNDTLRGGVGDDTYDLRDSGSAIIVTTQEWAGEGSDTFDLSTVTSNVTFDLNVQNVSRFTNVSVDLQDGLGGDGSANYENLIGSQSNANTLIGNAADNSITGGFAGDFIDPNAGNNSSFGRAGNDTITAGPGNDIVYGDADYDTIDYSTFAGPVTVNLGAHTSTGVISFTDVEKIIGSPSLADVVNGANVNTEWTMTGPDAVSIASSIETIDTAGIENLVGGTQIDRFHMDGAWPLTGTINGGAGVDLLDYSASTVAAIVDLTAGTATNTGGVSNIENVTGSSLADSITGSAGPNALVGGPGNDSLYGLAGNDTLTGGLDSDVLDGGSNNDRYVMTPGAGTDTIVEAPAGGIDTLDYSAFATSVSINLQTGVATGATGVAEIELILGSSAVDTLTGADISNTWNIAAVAAGTLNGTIAFGSIERLEGGSLDDTFNLGPAGSILSIDGKLGTNTLSYSTHPGPVSVNLATGAATAVANFASISNFVGSAAGDTLTGPNAVNTWNITGPNAGTLNVTTTFTSFENLTGGTLADHFVFADGMGVSGMIDAAAGLLGVLNYTAYTTPVTGNLETGAVTGVGGGAANITRIFGGSASDTLVGRNIASTWNVTALNAGNINSAFDFVSIENLTGGTADDAFVLADTAGVSGAITGGGGATNTLNYAAYTTAVTANLQTSTATGIGSFAGINRLIGGTVSDTLIGRNIANTWNITGANTGNVGGFDFVNVESLAGGTAGDLFVFTGATSSVTGSIQGLGGNDTLDYSAFTTDVSINLSTGTASNTGGVGTIETVFGGSGNDLLRGDANANRLVGNGGADILVGLDAADTLEGNTGRDILIGGNGADSMLGGGDDDILIGGTTTHDNSDADLINIRTRWLAATSATARITDIKTNVPAFSPTVTVFNDAGAIDTLTSGVGNDWFLREAADVTDFAAGLDNEDVF